MIEPIARINRLVKKSDWVNYKGIKYTYSMNVCNLSDYDYFLMAKGEMVNYEVVFIENNSIIFSVEKPMDVSICFQTKRKADIKEISMLKGNTNYDMSWELQALFNSLIDEKVSQNTLDKFYKVAKAHENILKEIEEYGVKIIRMCKR